MCDQSNEKPKKYDMSRLAAIRAMTDQSLLSEAAKRADRTLLRLMATERMEDKALAREVLLRVAMSDENTRCELKIQAIRELVHHTLQEEELSAIICFCGESLKHLTNPMSRYSPVQLLWALRLKYDRADIMAYDGAPFMAVRSFDDEKVEFISRRAYMNLHDLDEGSGWRYEDGTFDLPIDAKRIGSFFKERKGRK